MSAYLLGLGFRADMGTCIRKLVLLKLIDACEDDGSRIFPAIATIARAAQCSSRQAQREIRAMLDAGLLHLVREGGKGPRSTNEYRLDLDMLGRIARDGWEEACGRKGDTQSPLDDGEKGDSGDAVRVTGEADKGDNGSRTTPPDPSPDPSIERERADAGEEDRKKIERMFDRAWRDWPAVSAGSRPEAFREWLSLSADERQEACDCIQRWLAAWKEAGRKHVPALSRYLRERRWEGLPERREDPEETATIDGKAWGPHWSALCHREFLTATPQPAPPPTSEFLRRLLAQDDDAGRAERLRRQAEYGWPRVRQWFDSAQRARSVAVAAQDAWLSEWMEFVPRETQVFADWRAEYERRGWLWIHDPGMQRGGYFPRGGPAGLEAFEAAIQNEVKDHDGGGREAAE